jgi:hypothetical protein
LPDAAAKVKRHQHPATAQLHTLISQPFFFKKNNMLVFTLPYVIRAGSKIHIYVSENRILIPSSSLINNTGLSYNL